MISQLNFDIWCEVFSYLTPQQILQFYDEGLKEEFDEIANSALRRRKYLKLDTTSSAIVSVLIVRMKNIREIVISDSSPPNEMIDMLANHCWKIEIIRGLRPSKVLHYVQRLQESQRTIALRKVQLRFIHLDNEAVDHLINIIPQLNLDSIFHYELEFLSDLAVQRVESMTCRGAQIPDRKLSNLKRIDTLTLKQDFSSTLQLLNSPLEQFYCKRSNTSLLLFLDNFAMTLREVSLQCRDGMIYRPDVLSRIRYFISRFCRFASAERQRKLCISFSRFFPAKIHIEDLVPSSKELLCGTTLMLFSWRSSIIHLDLGPVSSFVKKHMKLYGHQLCFDRENRENTVNNAIELLQDNCRLIWWRDALTHIERRG